MGVTYVSQIGQIRFSCSQMSAARNNRQWWWCCCLHASPAFLHTTPLA